MPSASRHPSVRAARRIGLVHLLVAALVAAVPLQSFADVDQAARVHTVVDNTIATLMNAQQIPGMAVAVIVDGRSYLFTYGVTAVGGQAPVTADTLFEIGSVSKTLTATLAGYALVTGRMHLDDHPSRFVPSLRHRPIDQATLVELGTYTAGGLPLQFPDAVQPSDEAALAYLRSWQSQTRPGSERQYSNISIGLLGYVAGAALGEGFAQALDQQLLPRLGLEHTYLRVPASEAANLAWGDRHGQAVHASPGPFDQETYGIKTTVADLARFVELNIDAHSLEPDLCRAIAATHIGYVRVGGMIQGLAWEQYPWPVSREMLLGGNSSEMIEDAIPVVAVSHPVAGAPALFDKTGSTGGFAAYVAFIPSLRLGIVMLANKNFPIPARIEAAYTMLDALAPDQFR